MNEMVKFIDGEIEIESRFDGETVWLRQIEIANLFVNIEA